MSIKKQLTNTIAEVNRLIAEGKLQEATTQLRSFRERLERVEKRIKPMKKK